MMVMIDDGRGDRIALSWLVGRQRIRNNTMKSLFLDHHVTEIFELIPFIHSGC